MSAKEGCFQFILRYTIFLPSCHAKTQKAAIFTRNLLFLFCEDSGYVILILRSERQKKGINRLRLGLAWLGLAWLGLAWLGLAKDILSVHLCQLLFLLKNLLRSYHIIHERDPF